MRYILSSTLYVLVLTVCVSILSTNLDFAFADDSLDGKTFSIKISEHGKENEASDDELIFQDGTFFSADCEQYGFSPAPYETRSKAGTVAFKSTLTSDKEGKSEWEGKVKGESITGTFMWSKEGQDPIIYTYEGSLKQ